MWKDYRLKWNADKYGGLKTIYVKTEFLWIPDITLQNKYDRLLQFLIRSIEPVIQFSNNICFTQSNNRKVMTALNGISTTAALRCASLRCAAIVSDSPR